MQEMTSYLSNYCEEEPEWIDKYLKGDQISFKDVMSSRVGYYPGSGDDGTLMKVGNKSHSVHSFLYVDYMLSRKSLEERLDSIRGYHQVGRIEWKEKDLMPNGQHPLDISIRQPRLNPQCFVNPQEQPYCFSVFLDRDVDKDETWGDKHFVVTFLFADGIATYYQLFVKEYAKAPWLFLLQDHGFGGNYDRFGRGGILETIIRNSKVYPNYVICADNTSIWADYAIVDDVSPVFGGMHNHRRDLYKYLSDTNIK